MIAVTDNGSDKAPVCGLLDPEDVAGRGLGLVEVIAERWGHCGGRRGRTVWFELRWTRPSGTVEARATVSPDQLCF